MAAKKPVLPEHVYQSEFTLKNVTFELRVQNEPKVLSVTVEQRHLELEKHSVYFTFPYFAV